MTVPWIYDLLRPVAVGFIDHADIARFCNVAEVDRVFDLGCGTGMMVKYLKCGRYLGADLDSEALKRAARFAGPQVQFVEGDRWDASYRELRPSVVLMIGVVHHLADEDFHSMTRRLRAVDDRPPRIVTLDVSYFPGKPINNFLSRMDRGRHVRRPEEYRKLYAESGLRVSRYEILRTRLGYVCYVGYDLLFEE